MSKRKKNRIPLKSEEDIVEMRVACETASQILQELAAHVSEGQTTGDIDRLAAKRMAELNCTSAFLNYRGFPGHICISVNEEVVHGIGGERELKQGDLVKIDVGVRKNGWIGDNALTVPVGDINAEQELLLAATEQSLYEAIDRARAGVALGDLCASVEEYVTVYGFSVVRDLVGHGVGRNLHEEPQVPNYRPERRGPKLLPGMVLAIEPMINAGRSGVKTLSDGWTIVTVDGMPSSHFEHTVLVTEGEPDVLTARPRSFAHPAPVAP